jgi:PhnB protein
VTPYLCVRDAASAIKFYKKVFGAKENYRLRMAGKIGHAELNVGGAVVMLSDEFPDMTAVGPKTLRGTSVTLAIYVEDVDRTVAKAVKAGAKLVRKVDDQFYGHRSGQIRDPFGHIWSVNTPIEAVAPREMQKRLNAMMRAEARGTARGTKRAGRKAAAKALRGRGGRAKSARRTGARARRKAMSA